MIPLTDEENKSYEEEKVCYICKKEFVDDNDNDHDDDDDNKKYQKVRDHCPCARNTEKLHCQQKNLLVSLNAQEKIQKDILVFQFQYKKKLDNGKTIT